MKAVDGKMRSTDCANTKQLLRIIQSIPSKKAEPFKIWLAEVGKERLDEIMNSSPLGLLFFLRNYLSLLTALNTQQSPAYKTPATAQIIHVISQAFVIKDTPRNIAVTKHQ